MESVNLAVRFILEVGVLVALGHWGWKTGEGAMRWVFAIGAVLAAVVVWTLFVSPDPTIELARPIRLIIEFAVWLAAGAALWATGLRTLAIAFVVIALVGRSTTCGTEPAAPSARAGAEPTTESRLIQTRLAAAAPNGRADGAARSDPGTAGTPPSARRTRLLMRTRGGPE